MGTGGSFLLWSPQWYIRSELLAYESLSTYPLSLSEGNISFIFLVHDEQQLHSKYSFENYFESPVNGKLIILLI